MKTTLILLAILALVALCAIAGCRLSGKHSTEATVALTAKPSGRIAIVYYSQSQVQNTALVAKWIQKHVGGDLVPVEMVESYPEPYGETLRAVKKHHDAGTHPPIKPVPSLDGYDIVFLGSPIWYGTYAQPLYTFFDSTALEGKIVAPFCTHGGGGAGKFFDDVRKACPNAKVLDGLTIRGSNQIERRLGMGVTAHSSEDAVVEWLNRVL